MAILNRVLVVSLILTSVLSSGCHKKGKEPTPVRYRLFAGPPAHTITEGEGPSIYAFDVETDSLVDSSSLCSPDYFTGSMDSPVIAHGCGSCYRFLESETLATRFTLCGISDPWIATKDDLVVGFSISDGVYYNGVTVASLIDGAERYEGVVFSPAELDSADIEFLLFQVVDDEAGLVYGILSHGGGSESEGDGLIAYDYRNHKVHRTWRVRAGVDDTWLRDFRRLQLHPNGKWMYFIGRIPEWPDNRLVCFDLETEEVRFSSPAHQRLDYIQITPDGSQIWKTVPGGLGVPTPYDTITIYDASSGIVIDEIPLDTLAPAGGFYKAFPKQIRFVPGSEKGYLAEGDGAAGLPGRIVVLNLNPPSLGAVLPYEFGYYTSELALEVVPIE